MPDKDKDAKATKRLLQGVTFPDRTYAAGDEDDLEARLTQEQFDRLAAQDPPVFEGEWNPAGTGEEPMPRSKAALAAAGQSGPGPHPAAPSKPHPAAAENERLRAENAKLRAQVESAGGSSGASGTPAAGASPPAPGEAGSGAAGRPARNK